MLGRGHQMGWYLVELIKTFDMSGHTALYHTSTPYSSREHLTVKIYRAILLILYVCIPLHFNKSIICPWHFFFEIFFFVFLGFGPLPGP